MTINIPAIRKLNIRFGNSWVKFHIKDFLDISEEEETGRLPGRFPLGTDWQRQKLLAQNTVHSTQEDDVSGMCS
jgi:hypothetical protein